MGRRIAALALLTIAALGLGRDCRADFSLKVDTRINGDQAAGYLLATFETVTAGTATQIGEVKLTLDARDLVADEYVASWGFNVAPTFPGLPGSLVVARAGGTAPGDALSATVVGPNATDLGSPVKGGLFDVGFFFESAQARRFKYGQTIVFSLKGLNLTAESFLGKSAADGNNPGGYYSAADIRAIPGASSGSLGTTSFRAVPEPASLAMTCLGLGAAGLARRLRRRGPGA